MIRNEFLILLVGLVVWTPLPVRAEKPPQYDWKQVRSCWRYFIAHEGSSEWFMDVLKKTVQAHAAPADSIIALAEEGLTEQQPEYVRQVARGMLEKYSQSPAVPDSNQASIEAKGPPNAFGISAYLAPFDSNTFDIWFDLPHDDRIELTVRDAQDHVVATVLKGSRAQGSYHIAWDASELEPGTYVCQLKAAIFGDSVRVSLKK
jgi:hypothetical protein